ncbi:MAG: hypothetical protein ACJAWL_001931 [Motiliproteus sp.]|jgi:hypothetical protein
MATPSSASAADWVEIEVAFRSGSVSNRELGTRYGISDTSIRRRAKKEGWTKGAVEVKRERVKAHFAGESKTNLAVGLAAATEADVSDMELGLGNARKALGVVGSQLDLMEKNPQIADSSDLKRLSETNKINVEVIRRIRGLDEPDRDQDGSSGAYSIDDVLRERAKLLQDF